jgi:hypothetical protein
MGLRPGHFQFDTRRDFRGHQLPHTRGQPIHEFVQRGGQLNAPNDTSFETA